MTNRFRQTGIPALLACLLWLCLAATAAAHASLTAAVPADGAVVAAAPSAFSLSFSEPVSPLALRLVRPDGRATPLADFVLRDRTLEIAAPGDLGPGTHVLTFRVVSEDGHPVSGSTFFSIGAPGNVPPAAGDAVDWPVRSAIWLAKVALYIGLFFGVGGVFASAWLQTGNVRAVLPAVAAGLAGTALSAGLQGLDALGVPLSALFAPAVWKAGFETSYGRTVAVLAVAFVLAAAATLRLARPLSMLALVAGAAALALSGHASAAAPQWLTRPAVFLHAATIAVWIGALVPLALALRRDPAAGRAALCRFSRVIPYAVAVLAASGLALAVIQVGRPEALLATAYGNVLLVKAGLLVPLFALAAVNRWVLTRPAVEGSAGRLVRAIGIETVLVLAILGTAAAWRFTPPPRALALVEAPPAAVHIHSDKAMAEVTIRPGRAGPVVVTATVLGPDFGALAPREVVFVFSNPAAGVEPMKRRAKPLADGTWQADDVVLPLAGTWTLRLDVLVTDFDLVRLQGEIAIDP